MLLTNAFLKNLKLTFIIWLVHYFIYYCLFGFVYNFIDYWHRTYNIDFSFIERVLISPLAGIIGMYDGLVIIIPILVFSLLRLKMTFFKAYYISIILCHIAIYLGSFFFANKTHFTFERNLDDEILKINFLILQIPCLLLTIVLNKCILNWLKLKL